MGSRRQIACGLVGVSLRLCSEDQQPVLCLQRGWGPDWRLRVTGRLLLALALCLTASAAGAQKNPDQMEWGPPPEGLPPGALLSVLSGDPAKPGLFTIRLRFPPGYKVMSITSRSSLGSCEAPVGRTSSSVGTRCKLRS